MNDPDDISPTGRNMHLARSLREHPRHEMECPFCAAGDKAKPMHSVVEIDFSGVELRVLAWKAKDVEKLVDALQESGGKVTARLAIDNYVDPKTFATALGMPTMPVTAVAVPAAPVKRKNAPKGKRGRAQWWNR